MLDVSEINGLDQANNLPDHDELAEYADLRQCQRLERAAGDALLKARQARVAAENIERRRVEDARAAWVRRQMRAAAPDPGDKHVRETITIRSTYGHDPRPIKWDVIVDGEGGRSQYGMKSRHDADRYARENRSRGCAVRVVQSGQ